MKRLLFIFLLIASTIFACWFSRGEIRLNFNRIYIAGVNFDNPNGHYDGSGNTSDIENISFTNNTQVNLPITLWSQVNSVIDSSNATYNIRSCKLYYKILPGGVENENCKWRIANKFVISDESSFVLSFNKPIKLFGKNCLTEAIIKMNGDTIATGDAIQLVWFFNDFNEDCFSNIDDIEENSHYPEISINDLSTVSIAPTFIIQVIYTGHNIY